MEGGYEKTKARIRKYTYKCIFHKLYFENAIRCRKGLFMNSIVSNVSTNEVEMINLSQVYESLRYSEYSTENGIGELVDNAVEAGSQIVSVTVKSSLQKKEGKKKPVEAVDAIYVADTGAGMGKDILWQALVLGKSLRKPSPGRKGIGRFGVGMTLGSISISRRVEVYSRTSSEGAFNYTYIDLDEVCDENEGMKRIPEPVEKDIPEELKEFYQGKTGTVVVLTKCDRVSEDATELNAVLANYLGRTYRKFIEAGLCINFNGNKVFLHDPLYISGPTQFDTKETGTDLKATLYDEARISLEIPGTEGKTADVIIRLSLLPYEWRKTRGDGGSTENKKRKVDQNEGVSVLRANREVLYDKVPYLIGAKGQAKYEEKDRFWGCEISFPAELDDYFQVRYIKRGAEPVGALKDKLRQAITPAVNELRKSITAAWSKNELRDSKKRGNFGNVEQAVENAGAVMPASKKGSELTEPEEDALIDKLVKAMASTLTDEQEKQQEREERKEHIKTKRITLNPVEYPASVLFEPKHLMDGKMVININVNHPFYQKFIVPLCGNLEDEEAEISNEKIMMRDAIFLLFCSYAKASSMYDDSMSEDLLTQHLSQMGTFLGTMTREYSGVVRHE